MINERLLAKQFATELNNRMEYHQLRNRDLSGYCQLSENNLPSYRNGERLPNPWYLVMMSEKLECTVNELLGFDLIYNPNIYQDCQASRLFSAENLFTVYLSRKLKQIMRDRQIGVTELSQKSGVSKDALSSYLSKHPTLPKTIQLLRICDALDCTPSDLLGY